MRVKTVLVSKYPMFKEGLEKILRPDFVVEATFDDIKGLLSSKVRADFAILDEDASKNLDLLKIKKPSLTLLKVNLEKNEAYLVSESMHFYSSAALISSIKDFMKSFEKDRPSKKIKAKVDG